ncbi:glycyl-radical enzyme activating protein [Candidatus Zixiibacteriota bacterium]
MPITGTIFDIKKYAIHDGPGIRTTVFFKGCPLDCWWCHNPESRNIEVETVNTSVRNHGTGSEATRQETVGRVVTVDEVMSDVLKDVVFYDQSGGGVTISGGEPLHQIDFLIALLHSCKGHGIRTAVDTSGFAPPEDLAKISGLVDLFLYDLKIMDEQTHLKYTGESNRLILENLVMLVREKVALQIRIPLIPGFTDTAENLAAVIDFLQALKGINDLCLLPYNLLSEDKRRKFGMIDRLGHLPTLSNETMQACAARFRAHGYRVSIGG